LRSQGKQVHVFTASTTARALDKLRGAGLLDHVDNIYTSGINDFEDSAASGMLTRDTTPANVIQLKSTAKTGGKGYQQILDHLGTTARRVAMTGDHPVEDVAFSKKLGIFASQAKWYRNVPAQGVLPDLELTNPSQLTDIVRRANAA
jgi:FMN phosphatase YigB (HAD superfamily)